MQDRDSPTTAEALDDYRWLVSAEARPWLELAAAQSDPLPRAIARLRSGLTAARTHLVMEQAELRQRARQKFRLADQMFFTRIGLEQATDEHVAGYKASRIPKGEPIVDLCCGIGGDLVALAERGPVRGIDRDPVVAILATANGQVMQARNRDSHAIRIGSLDVTAGLLSQIKVWHLDPDRRVAGKRTSRVVASDPGPELIDELLSTCANAAVKLAPAAEAPDHWAREAELEWLSRAGQVRQQVAWFGELASERGLRRATIVGEGGIPLRSIVGTGGERLTSVGRLGRYLFEPDGAVIAAGLAPVLAGELQLAAMDPHVAYLTGDFPITDPALRGFEIVEALPFDLKRVRQALRARGIGQVEVKQRGVGAHPESLVQKLSSREGQPGTLILARIHGQSMAIIARRVVHAT